MGLQLAHKSQQRKPLGLTSLAFEKFVGRRDVEADARIDGAGGGGGGGGGEGSGGGGSNALVETGTYLVGSETGGVFKCFLNFAALHEKVCVCVYIYIYIT